MPTGGWTAIRCRFDSPGVGPGVGSGVVIWKYTQRGTENSVYCGESEEPSEMLPIPMLDQPCWRLRGPHSSHFVA